MRWVSHTPGENQGARRGRGADELGEAVEPGFLGLRHGTVLQQLLRHEKRSRRAGRGLAQRGGSTVPRRMQRGNIFIAAVVPAVVIAVVLRTLDVDTGVLRGSLHDLAVVR